MTPARPEVLQKQHRAVEDQLHVIIVGAGLGGLGCAISTVLAGHNVTILESATEIAEVGAGIQCLPNSTRVLIAWGLQDTLSSQATRPKQCNMLGWKGERISHMDFHEYEEETGTPFWDFHRANLHMGLLNRAVQLGAKIETHSRVVDIEYAYSPSSSTTQATAILANGTRRTADLIVGADGINSKCREILLGKPDPPILTGDLAYRLLLKTEDMLKDPDLRSLVQDPQVNYWLGPDAHAVNYVLRGGKLFNMVLLVPDDMPAGTNTLAGDVDEMRALYKDWDPRIPKLLSLCDGVFKWRLCIRPGLDPTWSHESGAFTILGDAAHATLPYLASGAGMSLEDGHVLGLCLGRLQGKGDKAKKGALEVYERCRRERTERVVGRGNYQQHLYHVHDGAERDERDRLLRTFGSFNGRGMVDGCEFEQLGLEEESDPLPWRWGGVGKWLLTYDCEEDVQRRWNEVEVEVEVEAKLRIAEGAKADAREVRAVL